MQTSRAAEQGQYNDIAVRTAEMLHEVRTRSQGAVEGGGLPLEKIFPPQKTVGIGVAREYERMGNRPVSLSLQSRADDLGYSFEHLGVTLGTVIHGIDLKAELSAEQVQFVRDTLLERKVIFFRDQHLAEDEQVAFGREFGGLDAFPFGKSGANPYILEIRHGKNRPGTENGWHTDVTWMERPSLGSIAQCVEVPPVGGDTLFSDSHAACLGLPPALRERIGNLHGVNDYRVFLMSRGPGLPDDVIEAVKRDIPFGVSHPLVRTIRRPVNRRFISTVAFCGTTRCLMPKRVYHSTRPSPLT